MPNAFECFDLGDYLILAKTRENHISGKNQRPLQHLPQPPGHPIRQQIGSMTPQEQSRMEQLCGEIARENNPERFLTLVRQLNDLLERSQHRLVATDGNDVRDSSNSRG